MSVQYTMLFDTSFVGLGNLPNQNQPHIYTDPFQILGDFLISAY